MCDESEGIRLDSHLSQHEQLSSKDYVVMFWANKHSFEVLFYNVDCLALEAVTSVLNTK